MEGFFGRLKVEFFCGYDWSGWSIDEFMDELDDYIRWCNEDRIKLSLGGMNPLRCRQSLGLAAQVFGVGKRRHPRMVIYFEQFAHLEFAAFLSTCPFCMSTLHARQDSPLNWTSLRSPLCGTFFFDLLEVGSFTGYSSSGWVMSAKKGRAAL